MNALYTSYVQLCNFGNSPGLAIMLLDFHQNCGLKIFVAYICICIYIYIKERLKSFNIKCYNKKRKEIVGYDPSITLVREADTQRQDNWV